MEKSEILSEIKQRLGNTSFSEKTIESYIDLMPVEEGKEPDDAYWDKAKAFLTTMQGQFNHDIATALKKQEPKQQPPKTEPKQSTEPTTTEPDKEILKLLTAIQEDNKKLKDRLDEQDRNAENAKLRADIEREMRLQGADDAYVLGVVLSKTDIDTSKKLDENVATFLERYDKELSLCRAGAARPRTSGSGGAGKGKSATDLYFEKKWAKEK